MNFSNIDVFPMGTTVNSQGVLEIGGCDIVSLSKTHGTPLYVYDENTIRNMARTFVGEFTSRYSKTSVAYASKAFLNLAMAKIATEENLSLDVVSGGEVAVANAAGFPSSKMYFHGNNKTPQELREAVQQGIGRIVVDSFHELQLLDEISGELGKKQEILVRVSPGIDPHTHAYTTTGIIDSKFGFSIQTGHAAIAVRDALQAPNLNLKGLHFHLGSPIFELEPYQAAIDLVLRFAAEFREEGWTIQEFSPGGGFAIAYTRDNRPPEVSDYAEAITSTLKSTSTELNLPLPRLIIEPGRSIIGPSGVALYQIGAIKEIPGIRKYVSVDGGMGDNIRPALYQASYEVCSAGKMNLEADDLVTIAGKYCESGDILASDVLLPSATSGDVLAIPASGAYCPSMASNYNLNPRPPIVLVKDGSMRLIRRRETYQDMMLCDIQ